MLKIQKIIKYSLLGVVLIFCLCIIFKSDVEYIEGSTENANYNIWFPQSYDVSVEVPLVIGFHGNGSGNSSWSDGKYPDRNLIREKCIGAGYIFCVVEHKDNLFTWGNGECIVAYKEVVEYILQNYNISKIGFFANSMGGIESLNFLIESDIKVDCYVGTSMAYDLLQIYEDGQYTDRINQAYDIANGDQNIDIINENNPSLKGVEMTGIFPVCIIGSDDDTNIKQEYNGFAFYEKMNQYVTCKKIIAEGGHEINLKEYVNDIMDFYKVNLE